MFQRITMSVLSLYIHYARLHVNFAAQSRTSDTKRVPTDRLHFGGTGKFCKFPPALILTFCFVTLYGLYRSHLAINHCFSLSPTDPSH